jgi:hypothetical protein
MALTGQTPGIPDYTYRGLLNLNNDALGLTASLRNVKDGLGNNSGIRLSTAEFEYTGIFTFASKTASTLIYLNASKQVTSLANAAGALTNDGAGNFSYAAGSSGITIGTTPITSGATTRLLYQDGSVVQESANLTYDGTTFRCAGDIEATGSTVYMSSLRGGTAAAGAAFSIRAGGVAVARFEGSGVGNLAIGGNYSPGSKLAVYSSGSASALSVGGKAKEFYLDSGNLTATGETNLYIFSILAGVLTRNGDTLYFKFTSSIVGAGVPTKREKVYFAGTVIYDSTAQVFAAGDTIIIEGYIIRVSNTVVRCSVSVKLNTGVAINTTAYTEITAINLTTTAYDLKLTGESAGVGSNNNDVVAKLGYVRYEEVSQ